MYIYTHIMLYAYFNLFLYNAIPPHTHCTLHTVTQEIRPSIIEPPHSTKAELSESANLTCTSTGASFTWFVEGKLAPGVVTPYFYIPSISIDNRGYYVCEVRNTRGTDRSQPALLSLKRVQQYEATLIGSRQRRQTDNTANSMVGYTMSYVYIAIGNKTVVRSI